MSPEDLRAALLPSQILRAPHRDAIPRSAQVMSAGLPFECTTCSGGNGAVYSIARASVERPLPHDGCTCRGGDGIEGVCRCTWLLDDREAHEAFPETATARYL